MTEKNNYENLKGKLEPEIEDCLNKLVGLLARLTAKEQIEKMKKDNKDGKRTRAG